MDGGFGSRRAGGGTGFRSASSAAALALLLVLSLLSLCAAPALAAKPSEPGHGHTGGGEEREEAPQALTGNDVSYPQCGGSLPSGQAFGIVGVNEGLANLLNQCLGPSPLYSEYSESELYWAAATSSGAASQPKASLYVNTADPGPLYKEAPVEDWPSSGSTPYGECAATKVTTSSGTYTVGEESQACAWEYGLQRASQDISWLEAEAMAIDAQSPPTLVEQHASAYPWWLDVETANSWLSGEAGKEMNVADLEGMVAALSQSGAGNVGIYSTESQWNQITGGSLAPTSSLAELPDWIPGARRLSEAESNCKLSPFTGGGVQMTQWAGHRSSADGDYAC